MTTLKVEDIDIRVTRKVVQVTPENIADESLVDFLETFNIICRPHRFPTKRDAETGTISQAEGVKYYEANTSNIHICYAEYGDYIVVVGEKEAYTLTAEELQERKVGA